MTADGNTSITNAMRLMKQQAAAFPAPSSVDTVSWQAVQTTLGQLETHAATVLTCVRLQTLLLVLISDGESSADDYAAAKQELAEQSFLAQLTSRYTLVRMLLIAFGNKSGVMDLYRVRWRIVQSVFHVWCLMVHVLLLACDTMQDVVTPICELPLISAPPDFMAVEDGTNAEEFVSKFNVRMQALACVSRVCVSVTAAGAAISARPILIDGRSVSLAMVCNRFADTSMAVLVCARV